MEQIMNFLKTLYEDYFYFILAGVIVLALIIFFSIVITVKRKKKKAEETKKTFIQESVQSLTPEEIDNISNNSADPVAVKQSLTTEVEELNVEAEEQIVVEEFTSAEEKKETKKPATKKAEPKKVEEKPATKKAEPKKAEEKPATKKAEPKKAEEKTATKKAEPKKAEEKTVQLASESDGKKGYSGKWKIKDDEMGFYACLTASNGGTLLRTEYYKSLTGVKNGIETIKKNIDGGNFAISVDKYGHYRFKLFTQSSRLLCMSEDYSSKAKCESGIESVKRFAKTAPLIREESETK